MTDWLITGLYVWAVVCTVGWYGAHCRASRAERRAICAADRAEAAEFRERAQRAECDGLRAELAAARDTTADAVDQWLRSAAK